VDEKRELKETSQVVILTTSNELHHKVIATGFLTWKKVYPNPLLSHKLQHTHIRSPVKQDTYAFFQQTRHIFDLLGPPASRARPEGSPLGETHH
jgi:hypothetical protein